MKYKIKTIIIIGLLIGVTITPLTLGIENKKQLLNQEFKEKLFDKYIEFLMKIAHKPSLATAIIKNDTIEWQNYYGYYDLENNKATNKDILYMQASVSKTVTATALMQLYEKGLFDLDDDINQYIPFELRNPNHPDMNITIRMLLSHRSSLADDNLYWTCLSYIAGDPDVEDYPMPWLEEYFTQNGSGYSHEIWSTDKPGEKYYYCNVAFSLLAYLVEQLSCEDFNEYCKTHIFEPLEMYNSSFRLRDHDLDQIAVPYEYKNGEYFAHPQYGIHNIYPAITLRTSVEEFSHFLIAYMNEGRYKNTEILNKSTIELMHTAHYSPNDTYNYGLGWQLKKTNQDEFIVSHSGGYVGVHTQVSIYPDDTSIIIFTNNMDSELQATKIEYIAYMFMKKALERKASKIAQ